VSLKASCHKRLKKHLLCVLFHVRGILFIHQHLSNRRSLCRSTHTRMLECHTYRTVTGWCLISGSRTCTGHALIMTQVSKSRIKSHRRAQQGLRGINSQAKPAAAWCRYGNQNPKRFKTTM
jgi:hypothetical protein